MENRYIITLSSSDKLIAAWKNKAINAGQEKMSTLVKNAILTFIEKGEFLDIGHIHFNPDEVTVKKGEVIPLQTARTPIISRWINANISAGLDISGPIKLLLSKCIRIIPETELEYFPPPKSSNQYSESSIMSLMKANAAKLTDASINEPTVIVPPVMPRKISETPEDIIGMTPEPIKHTSKESETVQKATQFTSSNPGNAQVLSGLNSLLPQRASKKT